MSPGRRLSPATRSICDPLFTARPANDMKPAFLGSPDYEHGSPVRTGLLVCNLGTPASPTTAALRRYLAEFLSDRRVVELPRALWLPILHGIILRTRPRRSARAYAEVWTDQGSPLLTGSQRLADALATELAGTWQDELVVSLAMRYGEPSVASGLDTLREAGARRVLVLPLYPQYAAATTASVFDAVFAHLRRLRWVPELRTIADYHAEPAYIEALAQSLEAHWNAHGRAERLLLSFHGIPRDYFLAGDPYHCQCQATARLLAERLALRPQDYAVAFQSRFGPRQWLEPYTDRTLTTWAAEGVSTVDVACPGFAVDCLETLEEIALRNAEDFRRAGGSELRYVPALNDAASHVSALAGIADRHLRGWARSPAERLEEAAARTASAERAAAMAEAAKLSG